jgi:hypothetical protein
MRLNQLICSFPLKEQEELAHLDETESGDADLTVCLEVPSTLDEVLENFQENGRTVPRHIVKTVIVMTIVTQRIQIRVGQYLAIRKFSSVCLNQLRMPQLINFS